MKKNGFTLVEVLVSLVLVSTILATMFVSLVKMRENYNIESSNSEIEMAKATITRIISKDINDSGGIQNVSCNQEGNECKVYLTNGEKRKLNIESFSLNKINYSTLLYSSIDDFYKVSPTMKTLYIKTLKDHTTSKDKQYVFGSMRTNSYSFENIDSGTSVLSKITIRINDTKYRDDSTYDVIISSASNYGKNDVQYGNTFKISYPYPVDSTDGYRDFYEEYGIKFYENSNPNESLTDFGDPSITGLCYVDGDNNKTEVIKDGKIIVSNTFFTKNALLELCNPPAEEEEETCPSDNSVLSDKIVNLVGSNPSVISGSGGIKKYSYDSSNSETNVSSNIVKTDYRYYGSNPNNYVKFSGTDELWRIIGIVDGKVKLIKKDFLMNGDSVFNLSWDSSSSSINYGGGVNEWSQSKVKMLLNDYYYGNNTSCTYCTSGSLENCSNNCASFLSKMSASIKKYVDSGATWYTAAPNINDDDIYTYLASDAYKNERRTSSWKICSSEINATYCNDTVTRNNTWTGAIGLISVSDYGYAVDMSTCNKSVYHYYDCISSNWLHQGYSYSNPNKYSWTISPAARSSQLTDVFEINYGGYPISELSSYAHAIAPSFYLKSGVHIKSGDGTLDCPYILDE